MRSILLVLLSFITISCGHTGAKRTPSSADPLGLGDETLTVLGDNFYGGMTNKGRALRVYLKRDPAAPGEYYFVFLEFNNLWHVAKEYGISLKIPGWAAQREKGFLKFINSQAMIYKMTPTSSSLVYDLKPLRVTQDGGIAPQGRATAQMKLWSNAEKHVLEGAHIIFESKEEGGPKKTWFPPENWSQSDGDGWGKKSDIVDTMKSAQGEDFPLPHIAPGVQYWMAKATYKAAKLKSSWRDNQIPGPYLASYNAIWEDNGKQVSDEVLHLENLGENKDDLYALFVDPSEKKLKERQKDFTNIKSAHLNGAFKVKKAAQGIFTMEAIKDEGQLNSLRTRAKSGQPATLASQSVAGEMNPRIGLFIDIFDNTEGGQDVVEVVYINPDDPKDFMMYYEHPDNGEGN